METIELILIKPEFSRAYWIINNSSGDEGGWLDRKTFVVPDGFNVLETTMGDLGIFDSKNNYCEIETNPKTKIPFVVSIANGYGEYAKLEPADLVFTKIKDLRRATGFTQREFADYFGIPKRTLEKWETGAAKPADYLVKLIEYKLRNENIITSKVKENQE